MVDSLSARWWVFALRGVLSIVFGLLALLWPLLTLIALALLVAAYLIVDGIAALYHAFARGPEPQPRWWLTFHGVLSLMLGLVIAIWPAIGVGTLVILFAFWAVASGVALIAAGWRLRATIPREWLMILAGVLSILVGVLVILLPLPFAAATALALLVGAYAVVLGVTQIALGLRMRRRGRHRANSPSPAPDTE